MSLALESGVPSSIPWVWVLLSVVTLPWKTMSSARIVVVGYGFWQERFGGRTNVLGEGLILGGVLHEIVGVAPSGFDFPEGAQLWRPLYSNVDDCGRGCHTLRTVARLASDATIEQASEELSVVAAQLSEAYGDTNAGKIFAVTSLNESIVGGEVRTALFVLFAAVGVVLLIASANVAHLLLARAATRVDEIAVRSALGATRLRILRQLFIESIVLAGLGAAAGLFARAVVAGGATRACSCGSSGLDQITLDGFGAVICSRGRCWGELALRTCSGVLCLARPVACAAGHRESTAERLAPFASRRGGRTLTRAVVRRRVVAAKLFRAARSTARLRPRSCSHVHGVPSRNSIRNPWRARTIF